MALVISIIVLLILATVSINLIINNGILDKANLAVDKYSEGEEPEQIQLDVLSAQMKNKLTTESLNIELQKILNNDKEVTEYSDYFFYKTNKSYRIYKDGKVEEGTLLPDEFQQVEYIESTGTQYIDTNTKYFDIGSIQIDFLLTKIAGTVFGHNCAGREVLLFYQGGKASCINGTNYTYEAPQKNHKYNVVFDITNGNASLTIDGNLVGTSTGSSNGGDSYRMRLFFADGYLYKRIYHFECTDNDGKAMFNFIPCKSTTTVINADNIQVPQNTKGMYDIVKGKFYTNQGSGDDFIAGPDV